MRRLGGRALAAVAVAVALAGCGSGGGAGPSKVSGSGYHFTLPAHWQKQSSTPAGVIAVYERSDHTALLTIRGESKRIAISRRFSQALGRQLRRRFRGYVPVAHRVLVTKAGPVLLFAYAQRRGGRLTSLLLVPAGTRSYVLDAVSNPTSKAATRDVASIFHSFVPRG